MRKGIFCMHQSSVAGSALRERRGGQGTARPTFPRRHRRIVFFAFSLLQSGMGILHCRTL
jgi:hypothetical protein